MRVELENGDWVDIADRLNYAQAVRINKALQTPEAAGELVAATVLRWALRGVDGEPITCPEPDVDGIPAHAIDLMPFDVFQQIAIKAADLLAKEPVPKGSAGRSPGSRSGRRSASRPSSPTRTSSSTPDGPTAISDLRRPA